MARNISVELRKKLKEIARARWERKAIDVETKPIIKEDNISNTSLRSYLIELKLLKQIVNNADLKTKMSGVRIYYGMKEKIYVEKESNDSVFIHIEADTIEHVTIKRIKDQIHITCECRTFEVQAWKRCDHIVAAAIFLMDLYELRPANAPPLVMPWKMQLNELLRKTPPSVQKKRKDSLLFFSFVKSEYYISCMVGAVLSSAIPPELYNGTGEPNKNGIAEFLKGYYSDLLSEKYLTMFRSDITESFNFLNATPAHQIIAKQEIKESRYPHRREASPNWQLLHDAIVFYGTEGKPFKHLLKVSSESASFQIGLTKNQNGLAIVPALNLSGDSIALKSNKYEVVSRVPLWLIENNRLFRVKMDSYQLDNFARGGEIIVPRDSIDEFLEQDFYNISNNYELHSDTLVDQIVTGINPTPRVYLAEENSELRVELRHAYNHLEFKSVKDAPSEHHYYDKEGHQLFRLDRNQHVESQWRERLGSAEFGLKWGATKNKTAPNTLFLRARVHPLDFLTQYIPKITAAGVEVYGEADLKLLKINRAKPSISFNITSGIDWFDIKAVINFGENNVSFPELRKAIRQQQQYIKLADGSVGEIPKEWIEKYKHIFGLCETTGEDMRVSPHHLTLLDQLLADNQEIAFDKSFQSLRKKLGDFNGVKSQEIPEIFKGELRPYQKAAFDWLHFLREMNFGGCLADDMGTGKTVSTLCFLQSLKEKSQLNGSSKNGKKSPPPHLLVLPRSIITNWERESQKFTPDLKLLNYSESDRVTNTKEFSKYDVILTTYGILLRDIELLKDYKFDTVILDEAQAVKNPVSETAKAVRLLKCNHKLTLTGTPVENNTLELWSQFAFLNPGMLGSIDYFRTDFATPIERDKDDSATKTLRRMVYPFILRRTKDQVALDLPPRTEKILWQEMEPDQRKLYERTRDEYRAQILKLIDDKGEKNARFRILEGLLRLRQICNHPRLMQPSYEGSSAKLDSLIKTMETLREEGHKVLIFSQFVKMLKLIEASLQSSEIKYSYLDGSTINRQKRVDEFQNDESVSAFLISLKAGGVGLNLTAADYVIHVDPWWNPAVEMQATDRAHRIGQNKPVFVYKLLMRDSVEEKIVQLQERKRDLVKQLITTDGGFFKSLTIEDMTSLFS